MIPISEKLLACDRDLYNCRENYIITSDGEAILIETMCLDRPVFNPSGLIKKDSKSRPRNALQQLFFEEKEEAYREATAEITTEFMSAAISDALDNHDKKNRRAATLRAKRKVTDYILANDDLQWFFTLTLNGEEFARDDVYEACKRLNKYLANRVQRKGLKYVFVPEYHKDGKSIHFHGLGNDAIEVVPSGTYIQPSGGKPVKLATLRRNGYKVDECKEVFNVPDWKYGFTTAVKVYGTREALAGYIGKYITKEYDTLDRKVQGRYYYSSNNLKKPFFVYKNADFDTFSGFLVEEPYMSMKIQKREKLTLLGK